MSMSSDESNRAYSGENERYAFEGEEISSGILESGEGSQNRDFEGEVRPMDVQPLATLPPFARPSGVSTASDDEMDHVPLIRRRRQNPPRRVEETVPMERATDARVGPNPAPARGFASTSGGSGRRDRIDNATNVTVDGEVNRIPSHLDTGDLERMMNRYGPISGASWRLPSDNEVACSDASPEVCLYEYMFAWGMRISIGERPLGFEYLVTILNSYGLSPGQLTANSFIIILGFWAFMYTRMGEKSPISKGPFAYFFELKERKKEERYHFS